MSSVGRMYHTDQTSQMCRLGSELNFCELHRVIIAYTALSEKLGMGTCGPERVPLRSLRFTNDPFLKTDLHIEYIFAKCLIFDKMFPLASLHVVKNTSSSQVTW